MEKLAVKRAEIPSTFTVCINDQCPRAGECLRNLVADAATEGHVVTSCLSPSQWKGRVCRQFAEVKYERIARGFTRLFDQILAKDASTIRLQLTEYLGCTKFYYQYRRGERPLTPAQQDYIRQLIRRHGYTWDVPFDSYEDVLCFPQLCRSKTVA